MTLSLLLAFYLGIGTSIAHAQTSATSGASCSSCNKRNLNPAQQVETLNDLISQVMSFGHNSKSLNEIMNYTYSYRYQCRTKEYKSFQTQYVDYIKVAATEFQVPPELLTCLIFIESRFNPQARSDAGAIGLAQFLPNTLSYVSSIIKQTDVDNKEKDKLKAIEASYLKALDDSTPNPSLQLKKDYEYSQSRLKNIELADGWKNYIDTVQDTKAFKSQYGSKKPWAGDYPTFFDRSRAQTPVLAIGAAALYLKDIMNNFGKNINDQAIKKQDQYLPFLTVVSGAYNMGPGIAIRIIEKSQAKSSNPKDDINQWVVSLEKNPETTKHMKSIKNCMEKDNQTPPYTIVNKKGKLAEENACE